MGDYSLIGKIVKTYNESVGEDMSGIVPFMYPDFLVKDEIFFDYDNKIIYTGPYSTSLKEELSHGTKEFIAVSNKGMADIDLSDRNTAITVLYDKWNRKISDSTVDALTSMSEKEFWTYFKKYWVVGRSQIDEKNKSLYSLYQVLGKQRNDILKVYYELREIYSDATIFSSTLGFIEKALNPDSVSSQNGYYLKLLNDFRTNFGEVSIKAVQGAYIMESRTQSQKSYRTLWLLMQLGRGNIL